MSLELAVQIATVHDDPVVTFQEQPRPGYSRKGVAILIGMIGTIWFIAGAVALAASQTYEVPLRNNTYVVAECVRRARNPFSQSSTICVQYALAIELWGEWQNSDGEWQKCRWDKTLAVNEVHMGWHQAFTDDCWEERTLYGTQALLISAGVTVVILIVYCCWIKCRR